MERQCFRKREVKILVDFEEKITSDFNLGELESKGQLPYSILLWRKCKNERKKIIGKNKMVDLHPYQENDNNTPILFITG